MHEGELVSGKYTLIRCLGKGGMGEVWLAHHQFLNQDVALKFLFPYLLADGAGDEISRKFMQEAQIGAHLNHPNIVRVRDFEPYQNTFFIVMDYINGQDLRDIIARNPLPEAHIIHYISQILSALSAAHKHNIIHRDIKPSNIFIDRNGRAYLADFGIAKALDSTTLGKSRMICTPEYAAPEQFDSDTFGRVSPATDLYSLGITMYHAATGTAPFTGTTMQVIYKQTHVMPPPPHEMNRSLSAGTSAVIMRAVEKRQGQRYQSAQVMADALKEAPTVPVQPDKTVVATPTFKPRPEPRSHRPVEPKPARPRRRSFAWIWVLIFVGAALTVGGIIWGTSGSGSGTTPADDTKHIQPPAPEPPKPVSELTVPNLYGKTLEEVLPITQQKWNAAAVAEVESDQPAGTVVAQEPAAGKELELRGTIRLTMSGGKATTTSSGIASGETAKKSGKTARAEEPVKKKQAQYKICPNCGEQNRLSASICKKCGRKI